MKRHQDVRATVPEFMNVISEPRLSKNACMPDKYVKQYIAVATTQQPTVNIMNHKPLGKPGASLSPILSLSSRNIM